MRKDVLDDRVIQRKAQGIHSAQYNSLTRRQPAHQLND
jgi:hypothetical protein